jgi:Universal stress protein family
MKTQDVAIPEQAIPTLHVRKILVPIDFSTPCKKAFKYAPGFARQFGSQIVMIHVIEPAPAVDTESLAVEGTLQPKREAALAEEKMEALADASRDGSLHITSGIRRGWQRMRSWKWSQRSIGFDHYGNSRCQGLEIYWHWQNVRSRCSGGAMPGSRSARERTRIHLGRRHKNCYRILPHFRRRGITC